MPRRQALRSKDRPAPDAYDLVLRLLGLRPHSELEVRQKLRRRGCLEDAIDKAVARARQLGYLDDAAFARSLVDRRSPTRGSAAVAAELALKGIDRETAREALGQLDPATQVEAARKLAARAIHTDRHVVASRLFRRGFSTDVIREALKLEHDRA